MGVYIFGFLSSILIIRYAQKKNKSTFILLSVIAILIPCFIAAVRDKTIGTDVLVYVEPLKNAAINSKSITEYFNSYWFHIWRNYYVSSYEIGFSILVYIVAKLFGNIQFVLFFIQLLTIIPLYLALAPKRKEYPIWLAMAVYYLMFYNASLNMMRQWIAMSFLLLSFKSLTNGNKKVGFLWFIVAYLFHTSALIGIIIYFAYKFIYKQNKIVFMTSKKFIPKNIISIIFLSLIAFIAVFGTGAMIRFISILGLNKFTNYINGNVYFLPNQIMMRLPLIILYIFNWRKMNSKDKLTPFYFTMICWDLIASQLISVNVYAFRISMFFAAYNIFFIPTLVVSQKKKINKILITILIFLYLIYYWCYTYVIQGMHATIPYVSNFNF